MLEQLIQALPTDSYLAVSVEVGREAQTYPLFLLHLYCEKSSWQIEGFDLEEEKRRIVEQLSKREEAFNLVLELGPKAIAQFKN